ncbi:hypothetical protein [Pseudoalteromonas luteoviolacea]|uniref:hypothetical protein n=1 Tax=Pseudoalteromonas luteoviolacea TaxID=43657 RepID=UPI001B37CC7C|nr:hypothetical protein [Pseudoalteromonas luteoviolacea]MBQ4837095.1 hypothetical protein [Pseudoalteromonas luteoviolacea]
MFNPKYTVKLGEKEEVIGVDFLQAYAAKYKLDRYANGRFSWFFVLQMFMYHKMFDIEPYMIVDAIKELEGCTEVNLIKKETQFKRKPLKGLWHKHYFSARFLMKNIVVHHGQSGIKRLIAKHWDGKSEISDEQLSNIIDDFGINAFQERSNKGNLTGEWIVFAKYNDENYYLSLGEHSGCDRKLYEMIVSTCTPQFKFLSTILEQS